MVFLVGIVLKSLGLEALSDQPEGNYSAQVQPPSRDVTSMTLSKAVGLPAVNRSLQILYGVGGRLPFDAWRGPVKVPRQPQLVTAPDPWRPRRSWTVRAITGMAGDGNCFLRLNQDPLTDTRSIINAPVLNPFAVRVRHDESGRKVYDHATRDGIETLSSEQVEHIWLNEFPGMTRGLGPIEAARLMLTGAMDTAEYANGWFRAGAVPPGVLSSDQAIDEPTATANKKRWHEGDSSQIKVLGKGLHFEPILIKPEDAQWIEAQKFSVLAVAQLFGIPPVMLAAAVDGSSLTYQNLQMVHEQLLNTTLFPLYLDPIAAALSSLTPAGQEVRFDTTDLLRRDDKTRMDTHKIAIEAGVYDADYARGLEGIEGPAPTPATGKVPA